MRSPSVSLDKVLVGKVLEKNQHPEADRLSVCSVEVGAAPPKLFVVQPISNQATEYRLLFPELNYPADLKSKNPSSGSGIGRNDV